MLDKDRGMLFIDLPLGESVNIDGGRVVMTLESKSGQVARLKFDAERSVSIRRSGAVAEESATPAANNRVALMAANGIRQAV